MNRSLRFSIFVGCFYCITALGASSVTADQLANQSVEVKNENLIEPVEDFICQTVDEPKVELEPPPKPPEPVVEVLPQVEPEPQVKMAEQPAKVDDGRIEVNFKISYYTSLACENTKYGAVDALGNPLVYGTIAVPKDVPLKSKFYIDGKEFTARDRGSKIKWIDSSTMKIDMFIPRNKGESDNAYFKRVNNMGIQSGKGYYIPYKK